MRSRSSFGLTTKSLQARSGVRRAVKRLDDLKKQAEEDRASQAQFYNFYNLPKRFTEFTKLCRIRSGFKAVPFALYPYQEAINSVIDGHINTFILKDRQLGITELFGARILYGLCQNSSYMSALISINQQRSGEVSDRIKSMASKLSVKWARDSRQEKVVAFGGTGYFPPTTPKSARGLPSVIEMYFDEAGFQEKFSEIFSVGTGAQEAVEPEHKKTVLCTTVPEDGVLSEFWRMFATGNDACRHTTEESKQPNNFTPAWELPNDDEPFGESEIESGASEAVDPLEAIQLARSGSSNCGVPGLVWWTDSSGAAKVIISHKAHPIYSKKKNYLEDVVKRRKIPMATAKREHDLGIESAEGFLFEPSVVDANERGAWCEWKPDRHYVAAIDPNFGGEKDSDQFVCLILDVTAYPYRVVAEYAESDRTITYSTKKAIGLIEEYHCPFLGIEVNSGGKAIAEKIYEVKPSLYIGLTTTSKFSKVINTDRVAYEMEEGNLIYPVGWKGKDELLKFHKQTREAVEGNDDRVMALAAIYAHIEEAVRYARCGSSVVSPLTQSEDTFKAEKIVASAGDRGASYLGFRDGGRSYGNGKRLDI